MISAKVIADSISPDNIRLTTLQLQFPKFILAEFNTHRMFSRNASSSRAIPTKKLSVTEINEPIRYGLNQTGMQASEQNLKEEKLQEAKKIWNDMAAYCLEGTQKLTDLGLHKQWANRPIEWFTNVNVVVSSTNWSNFFALRDHADAQPEIRELAIQMKKAMAVSIPQWLNHDQWHLPYVNESDNEVWETLCIEATKMGPIAAIDKDFVHLVKIKCSVARCARVSYLTHDQKKPDIDADLKLYDRLLGSQPIHASPAEHQAHPDNRFFGNPPMWKYPRQHGNFEGWIQYRKTIPGECQ